MFALRARTLLGALVLASAACKEEAAARPQIVVVVDTDLFVPEDLVTSGEISPAAVIDTVRVDLLDQTNKVTVFREFAATSRLDWPLSFGLTTESSGAGVIRLRIRGFRAKDAEPVVEGAIPTLSPLPELAVDRVIELPAPSDVRRVLALLSGGCLGRPASFSERTSCVDAGPPRPFGEPLPDVAADRATAVGTTTVGRAVPCTSAPIEGRVCIPGGLGILGSRGAAGLEDGILTVSPLPTRLVRITPFWMDKLEMTVGRAKRHILALSKPPYPRGEPSLEASRYCTYLPGSTSADALPLNCVEHATAKELCALEGGRLPTEAEWNHAATGRGEGRRYPWGETRPTCCTASLAREGGLPSSIAVVECKGEGVETAGSHPTAQSCADSGDESRDGVLDLGGSLTELVSDRPAPLDDPCWGPRFGVLVDPSCPLADGATTGLAGARGSSWPSGLFTSLAALRHKGVLGATHGLRCVYADGGR